jgi:cytochrome c-type biogenesis protein CcmE
VKSERKMGIIGSICVVVIGLGYLAFGNFGENLVYFVTPSEVVAFDSERYGQKVRVGGMVVEGSMKVVPETLKIKFDLSDGAKTIPVAFEGIPRICSKREKGPSLRDIGIRIRYSVPI